jgi:dephospho-CoA kinase
MIIGITGTPGAGKGAVVDYLVKEKSFTHYSARNFFAEKMQEQGIEINRDTMIDFANNLRKEFGPRYVFDELYKRAQAQGGNVVIESIRAIGEATALQEKGGSLLSIDANPVLRYERIHGRGSALDKVTVEEFMHQQEREMHSEDSNNQNIAKVMEMADYTIENNQSLNTLHADIEKFLETVAK